MIESITYHLKRRFCRKCGTQMLLRESYTGKYDTETGQPLTVIKQVCPKFLEGPAKPSRFSFRDPMAEWLGHESTEEVFMEGVDVNLKKRSVGRLRNELLNILRIPKV